MMNLILEPRILVGAYWRPYVQEFLAFAFANFATVSLWTSENSNWLHAHNFIPLLQNISLKLSKPCQFSYILTSTNCVNNLYVLTKPLIVLARMNNIFNIRNTLIIDDIPVSFMHNINNGIYMPNDKSLLILREYLLRLLGSSSIFGDVTTANIMANVGKPWYEDSIFEPMDLSF